MNDDNEQELRIVKKQRDKLREKLDLAVAALEWYANSKNIDPETGVHGTIRQCNHPLDPIEYDFDPDGGARAEEALYKIRDEK